MLSPVRLGSLHPTASPALNRAGYVPVETAPGLPWASASRANAGRGLGSLPDQAKLPVVAVSRSAARLASSLSQQAPDHARMT